MIRLLQTAGLLLLTFGVYGQIPVPTAAQAAWQEAELGVVFHYDLHVFDGKKYNQSQNRISPVPDYNIFAPDTLDTDQWIKAAKDAGARFAILTVTHETGFALYQSDVNPYCMKALKWKNGKGDLLRDFVNSCRKYGLKPGVYLGIRWNSFLGIHDFKMQGSDPFAKNRQQAYKKMCEGMVEEVTTRYEDLFMIWFDGGASDPKTYGADILPIVERNQPNCLFYHNAQRADFRWGGSETGTVPYPCWATYPFPFSHAENTEEIFKNNFQLLKEGDKNGRYYMPAMADAPIRGYHGRHEWFWEPGDVAHIYPVKDLVRIYLNSVGHNATLVLGLTPNPDGLLDPQDVDTLAALGREIRTLFDRPLAAAGGTGKMFQLRIPDGKQVGQLVVQEDITKGQRIRAFEIQAYQKGQWRTVFSGTSVGHKMIAVFPEALTAQKLRLFVKASAAGPVIRTFAAYQAK